MILGIATVVVLVLLAVALLPTKKRDGGGNSLGGGNSPLHPFSRQLNFRQQQLHEEAEAISDEYQRRANEAWRDELGEKAAALLQPKRPANSRAGSKS